LKKSYESFTALTINPKTKKGGLDPKTTSTLENISRYGIEIKKKISNYGYPSDNRKLQSLKLLEFKEYENLNKFFFYYFK
jgi:hypothetical protein